MKKQGKFIFHVLAIMTMALWGVTFVATKTLINEGLTPAQIFTIRFIIAYFGLLAVCFIRGGRNNRTFAGSLRDEFLFVITGITGGSLYFLTENTALQYTQACNVSFIVCIAPLLTILLTLIIKKMFRGPIARGLEDVKVKFPLIAGTVIALTGMVMVVFDGNSLSLSPKGDILAFMAALSWAVYSQFSGQMANRYGTLYATRKVFFYGLLTIMPVLLLSDNSNLAAVRFDDIKVWGNLLFLSTIASLFCFVLWNRILIAIGNVTATNYVYLNPVFTLIGAILFLSESMTLVSGIGSAMILGGVILSGVKKYDKKDFYNMKSIYRIMMISGLLAMTAGCGQKKTDFKYLLDEFADLKVMRYTIPGWEELSLQQKEYAYHLAEAAKWGRDIHWDQNCKYNLPIRHVVENILENYKGERNCNEFEQFTIYAKRLFFANGIHHHYAEDKFFPECSQDYFKSLMEAVGDGASCSELLPVIYDPNILLQRRSTSTDGDIVVLSAGNFYEGVTRAEVEKYYDSIEDKGDETPIAYGLNTKVTKDANGNIVEIPWKIDGMYGPAIKKICEELKLAAACAENDTQKRALALLIKYYETGDLKIWDEYNIEWVKDTLGTVDYINGFIEDYNDPLGRKGAWEGHVNIKDHKASERSDILSANAQWFEDNSPVDARFKKTKCKGISAKVINAVCLSGDCYPSTPIGINLPNADWIRKMYGSKSVTIANITHAYDYAAQESPNSTLDEFAWDDAEKALYRKWGTYADEIHTDLHECLGHGSGQLLPGVSSTAMGEYASALEEARADLFGLYYTADPKMVELGIMPDKDAYKAEYSNYIRNGIMMQFTRVELGRPNTEAHMQNRKLIAEWCYEKGLKDNVIEKKVRDGKTYFVVNDFVKLRSLFAELLAEIQRIKSEGDYEAGKNLIETYAVHIDPTLHKEIKERYEALNLKPYGGFINPDIVPVEKDGKIVDYEVIYNDDYLKQQLDYGRKYATLK